jgi:hypothetical protein
MWNHLPTKCCERGILGSFDVHISAMVLRLWNRVQRLVERVCSKGAMHDHAQVQGQATALQITH